MLREAILTRMVMNELEAGLTEAGIQMELLVSPIPALLRLTPNEITPFISAIARSYRNNTPEQWAWEKARIAFLAGPIMEFMGNDSDKQDQAA